MQLQKELLHSASEILLDNGLIAYVTCSPHLNETRFQVKEFLRTHRDFELATIPTGIATGKYASAIQADGMFQLWTHTHGTDAMFLALLQRKESKVKNL
jgi:16S rRNA (cytosine967-C5)-methyltransferase